MENKDDKYLNFVTPIGRLVSGSPDKATTTDATGEPLKYKSGDKKGQNRVEYRIGIAFAKNQADVPPFLAQIRAFSKKQWPNLFDANNQPLLPSFSDKITDGDSTEVNKKGNRPCDNENWRGHWVIWFNSDTAPTCVSPGSRSLIPAADIKTGYYVRVQSSCSKNTGDTPGMYMNLDGLELAGHGELISNKPDTMEAFKSAGAAACIPAGMEPAPGAAATQQAPSPATPPPPQNDVYAGPVADPPPPPIPAGPDPEEKFLYQGNVFTRARLLESGWTEAHIMACPKA